FHVTGVQTCALPIYFLSIEKFREIYKTTAALVINSYRQHALGNIFTALLYGVKIYLNPKSSTYPWLKQLGFQVFDINQLITDIRSEESRVGKVSRYR